MVLVVAVIELKIFEQFIYQLSTFPRVIKYDVAMLQPQCCHVTSSLLGTNLF